MQTAIMKNERRLVVFTEENCRRLAAANESIRRIRVRGGLLRVSEIHLDNDRPLIQLEGLPPEILLEASNGFHSRKIDGDADGRYVVRCTAYGCDWSWFSAVPAVHVRKMEPRAALEPAVLPDNVVVHPMFGGPLLRTAGDAR